MLRKLETCPLVIKKEKGEYMIEGYITEAVEAYEQLLDFMYGRNTDNTDYAAFIWWEE